jgi:hypothetical protein
MNPASYHFWEIAVKKSYFWIIFIFLIYLLEPLGALEKVYSISGFGKDGKGEKEFSLEQLESKEKNVMGSHYFDKGMGLKGTRLTVVPFVRLLEMFPPPDKSDSLWMDGADDYEAVVSIEQAKKYNLFWATNIQVANPSEKPEWMNPLALVVPDSQRPPEIERFLPANIKTLRYIRWDDYYRPISKIARAIPSVKIGFEAFTDDCLFCHSLKGVGGNKGGDLTKKFQLFSEQEQGLFAEAFIRKHYARSKNFAIEDFLRKKKVNKIVKFLSIVQKN